MRRVLAVVAVCAVLTGCASDRPTWGRAAEDWMDGWVEMRDRLGGTGTLLFLAPDFTWNVEPLVRNTPPMEAHEAAPQIGALPPESFSIVTGADAFLDTTGAVFLTHIDWSHMDATSLPPDLSSPATIVGIAAPIGPDGARELTMAMSVSDWSERRHEWDQGERALALAQAWTGVWSSGDDAERLYARNATIDDPFSGLSADGLGEVESTIAGHTVAWTIVEVEPGGDAVFPITRGDFRSPLRGFVAVVAPVEESACPGPIAVVAEVRNDLIVAERRFWTVDGARRCVDRSTLPGGWWDEAPIPEPARPGAPTEDLSTPTDPLVLADGTTVMMINGSTALRALVDWGLDRFVEAGLDRPTVDSVTFTRYSDFCEDVVGRVWMHDRDRSVTLCLDDEAACADEACTAHTSRARRAILHELAHLWMRDHLTEDRRLVFTRSVGLTEWSAGDLPWAQQAREHAAETIAWGLMDHDMTLIEIGSPAGDVLADRFAQLTGAEPIR